MAAGRIPQARITDQGVKTTGEGRAARKAGGAAWHPLWLKWRGSLGETHLPDSPGPPLRHLH